MRQRYVSIALPKSIVDEVDQFVKSDDWGFKSRAEFCKTSIRELLLKLKDNKTTSK